jgi:3-deoxy-D-manno-octulosonate 8-phosphate phosphatase (KDO 8-P phosphatase)
MLTPKVFVLDVDGVLTDGKFYYTHEGKVMKVFGPDDHDALKLLRPHLDIHFVSADHRGFEISQSRIERDMQFPLHCVSALNRPNWIKNHWPKESIIYMGDGIFDCMTFKVVDYSICPINSDRLTKSFADYVCQNKGGERAVSEACLHILERFFQLNPQKDFLKEISPPLATI